MIEELLKVEYSPKKVVCLIELGINYKLTLDKTVSLYIHSHVRF